MSGRFQWMSDGNHSHGVPATLIPGEQADALCGEPVVMPRTPLSQATQRVRCAPTCEACDIAWRTAEGIPMRRHPNGARP